jgi:subtilisin family serine protease
VIASSLDRTTAPEILASAILLAVDQGANVINLSLGTTRSDAIVPLYRVCERAARAGVVIVAATARTGLRYPAGFANVISVGAGTRGGVYGYRCRDGDPEFLASGLRLDASNRSIESLPQVASMAAPRIVGLAALLLERWPG